MNINSKRVVVELERGGFLPVHDGAGARVVCVLRASRVALEAPPASGWPIALSPLRLLGSAG